MDRVNIQSVKNTSTMLSSSLNNNNNDNDDDDDDDNNNNNNNNRIARQRVKELLKRFSKYVDFKSSFLEL